MGEVCADCGRRLVAERRWRQLGKDERRRLKAAGTAPAAARGLCSACYQRAWHDGSLIDRERQTMARREILAEFEFLDIDRSLPLAERFRQAAQRLGVTYKALERAYYRNKGMAGRADWSLLVALACLLGVVVLVVGGLR